MKYTNLIFSFCIGLGLVTSSIWSGCRSCRLSTVNVTPKHRITYNHTIPSIVCEVDDQTEINTPQNVSADKKINTQANVDTIAQATEMVKQAEQKEHGYVSRMYTKVKRMVTAPVYYIFGKEISSAQTAFYVAVELAIVAAGIYGEYQYGFDHYTDYSEDKRK